MKSFKNETCNSNFNYDVYKLIKPGFAYLSVFVNYYKEKVTNTEQITIQI